MDIKELQEALKERCPGGVTVMENTSKDTFDFKCDTCGKCCTGSTSQEILLSPFDIYNMAKGLNMKIDEVIDKYTEYYLGNNSNFIVVRLLPKPRIIDGEIVVACQLLKDGKCSIHNHKPSTCRLYPLGRAAILDKADGNKEMVYFLQNHRCGGTGEHHTVDEWYPNKEIYDEVLQLQTHTLEELNKIMDLHHIDKYITSEEKEQIINNYYSILMVTYYCIYDLEKDFLPQFKKNIEIVKKLSIATKQALEK